MNEWAGIHKLIHVIAIESRSGKVEVRYSIKFNSLICVFPRVFGLSFNVINPIFQARFATMSRSWLVHPFTAKVGGPHHVIYRLLSVVSDLTHCF